jgi:hypothetical protein
MGKSAYELDGVIKKVAPNKDRKDAGKVVSNHIVDMIVDAKNDPSAIQELGDNLKLKAGKIAGAVTANN